MKPQIAAADRSAQAGPERKDQMGESFSNAQRAEVLTQALPYIRRYVGKIVVVKYGGNAMINEVLKQQVMEDIVLLWLIGVKIVLVHGGGPEISDMMTRMGKQPEFVDGLRVTDQETVDIVQMVLAGKVNKTLVNLLEMKGGKAIGLSGIDGRLIECRIRDEKLGFVGDITKVHIRPITDLLSNGYIPVISTVGCDREGHSYNINGDTAAAHIAGVLRDRNDPASLIPELSLTQVAHLKETGIISGGMIPKVGCCVTALEQGVRNAVIMDGRIPHSILMELLTDEGAGTWIHPD